MASRCARARLAAVRFAAARLPPAARAALLALSALAACTAVRAPTHPDLTVTAQRGDPLALSDALENLVDAGRDTPADREYAFEVVRRQDADTAAAAFARAAITGRLVQVKGLRAAYLVADIERDARRSRELDPDFRDGAATRLLGTLYVMAPATLLKYGDSETGLELLDGLTAARPDVVQNHLRLAEAYVTLHDLEPAGPHLCFCLAHQAELRVDEQRLLTSLLAEAGPLPCAAPAGAK